MKLVDFLSEETIICPLKGEKREEVVDELLTALAEEGYIRDRSAAVEAIEEREKLGSTAVGGGVALPHARTDGVDGLVIALGVSENPIEYEAPDDEPVRIVALLLTPKGESALYVKLLGAVARLLKDDQTKKQLLGADSPRKVLRVVRKSGVEVEPTLRAKDIMICDPPVLKKETSLKEVVDLMFKHQLLELPVVDDKGSLIGMMFIEDLLKVGLPEYLFNIGDVSFLSSFEPFEKLLRQETELKVGDVMSKPEGVIECDVPMIQAALLLVRHEVRSLVVVENRKPVGIVSLFDFIRKVLRA